MIVLVLLPFSWLAAQADEGVAFVFKAPPNDPNLGKVAMLRLWYISGPDAPSITLVREPQGKPPLIVESGIQSGIFSPYIPLAPGGFKLHILDGSVVKFESDAKKIFDEKKLAEPIDVQLDAGAYQTLVLVENKGIFEAKLHKDKPVVDGSSPVVRIHDFSGLSDWTVRLLDRKNQLVQALWSSAGGSKEPVQIPGPGIYRIQVQRLQNGELHQMGLFESQLTAGAPVSVILHPGPGGEGAARLAFDSSPGNFYNAAVVKKIAEGAPTE